MSNTNPSTAAEAPKTPLPEITLRVIAGEALTAVGIAGLAAWGIQALDFTLSSGTVTLLTGLAAIAIVVAFSLFTRPQKNR